MKRTLTGIYNSHRWNWLIIASISAAAIIMGSLALASDGNEQPLPPVIQRPEDAPVPFFHRFISHQSGEFYIPRWDDREISDDAKRADPWYDPAWVPFSQCLAAGGLEVRADRTTKFNQDDIDRLVQKVNRENPNKAQNIKAPPKPTGSAGVFTRCTEEWLTKSPDEIEKLTGVTESRPK